jgi:hypothetical protein
VPETFAKVLVIYQRCFKQLHGEEFLTITYEVIVVQLAEIFHMFYGEINANTLFPGARRSQENSVHILKPLSLIFSLVFPPEFSKKKKKHMTGKLSDIDIASVLFTVICGDTSRVAVNRNLHDR